MEQATMQPIEDPRAQLEEMAQALDRGRSELTAAMRHKDELEGPYHAACARVSNLRQAVETIERGMHTTRKAYAIKSKLDEMQIPYLHPIVMLTAAYRMPEPWFLAAVAMDGTGLYMHTPKRSHRYQGKVYAVLASVAEEPPYVGTRRDAPRTSKSMEEAGLISWSDRGVGAFGKGTGGVRPLAPPDGGRWRWIKVDEQALLGAGDGA